MARFLKVLLASVVIAGCILSVCFIFGPYIFGLEAVGEYLGGNVLLVFTVITAVVYPLVSRKLL